MRRSICSLLAAMLLPLGCWGTPVGVKQEFGWYDSSTGAEPEPASEATTAVADGTSDAPARTDDAGGTTGEAPDPSGVVFLLEPDGGGLYLECDLFEQDCPRGEKCMPWGNAGDDDWTGTRCHPVVEAPAGVGETCHVQGWPTSGLDDCDFGSMCWNLDDDTLEGTCSPFCVGDESNPRCEDPRWECPISSNGALLLCVFVCDPIAQDCPAGQACYPLQDDWACVVDASGAAGAYGDACAFINVCDPGLICLDSSTVPSGLPCEGEPGCCTEVCDLDDPLGDQQCAGAGGGQTCQAWYEEGAAPPGLEDVGACALPQ